LDEFYFMTVVFWFLMSIIRQNFVPLMLDNVKGLTHDKIFSTAMNNMDWKDALGKAFNLPANEETAAPTPDEQPAQQAGPVEQQGGRRLDIVFERKGRGGKQATIVTGFVCDDEALKTVASQLKRSLGVGGSARGGEILIQGDRRQQVLDLLQGMGFKARVI
jgi:translation initiation factor 1